MALPVALQLYTVRDDLAKDFEGTIQKVAAMGYQGVEPAGYPIPVEKMMEIFKKYGLACPSAHVPLAALAADPEGELQKCKLLGMKYAAIPYLGDGERPAQPGFEDTLTKIRVIGSAAKKLGITLLYHNHDFEFVKIGDKYGLDVMYETIPADLLQTELDTCWVNVGGEDPAAFILKYSGRAPVVHLKDFVMKGKKPKKLYALIGIKDDGEGADEEAFSFRPVGYGAQDIPAILEASEKAGAEWVVVEQDMPAKGQTPLESAALSREYLKKLGW
ncbi:MAG: sugar phosphate isomerase/epimerase [Clostridia bacterium]|nr:sugar phosphate isomerase/epimerase [Clostridia bacterium]